MQESPYSPAICEHGNIGDRGTHRHTENAHGKHMQRTHIESTHEEHTPRTRAENTHREHIQRTYTKNTRRLHMHICGIITVSD